MLNRLVNNYLNIGKLSNCNAKTSLSWGCDNIKNHLVENCCEVMRVFPPSHIAIVVCLVPEDNLLHAEGVGAEWLLVMTGEEITIASPGNMEY